MNTSASGMQDVRNWEVERIGYMESSVNTSDNVTRKVISIGRESSRNDNLGSLGNDGRGRICRPLRREQNSTNKNACRTRCGEPRLSV